MNVVTLLPLFFWLAMTSDSAVLHSRHSVSTEGVPPTETMQEIHELGELIRLTDELPTECRSDFYRVIDRLAAGLERRQRMLGYVQDSLTQMSLDLKYLLFDIEATRRERDEYRRLAERHEEHL